MNLTSGSDPAHFFPDKPSGGSFQQWSRYWNLHNISILSRKGGNNSESALNMTFQLPEEEFDPLGGHTVWQVIIIVFLTGSLSFVTVVGNILVLMSFKVNKSLKTVNNYYLLSLAFADLTIGTLSMNLYTTYIIMGQWALGPVVCDLWLAIDYVASNASVMNLLVISFDRYFSVTRPLTYRAKRTTKRAMTMIGLAWSISFILWAPAILFWQYIVGERTVQPNECYIQFLSEPIITFCTAIAAFYLPVSIMAILFWKIYQETEKRAKDIQSLKGSGSGTNPSQAQNLDNGGGKDAAGSQRMSLIMLRQMSSQSASSSEICLSSPERNRNNNSNSPGVDNQKCCRTLCFQFSAFWTRYPASNRSCNTTTSTVEEAECSSVNGDMAAASEVKKNSQNYESVKVQKGSDGLTPSSSLDQSVAKATRDAVLVKRFATKAKMEINKRKNEKKANEKKAARTLSAILFAFITTWLPYNIMVLVNTFCQDCIPESLWALGYWLCYVNSTVNPMCYALCNKTFRTTFRDILICQWNQNRNKPNFNQRQAVSSRKEPR
ncbi:muscarinic acetylcholine receptor M1-like [Gambusia affinis]|uniref:muscarinic acetylcholine receptor M1-like n=1 Tax=Gambusia affinis TaxID=33528 RepID=UPI001CDD2999|nr:muscarinic acetylcholine receptor M1-like [Gambusia affinis]